jgi:hypothetical protein
MLAATALEPRSFNGDLMQRPDQLFIDTCWFRKDWFDRPGAPWPKLDNESRRA